MDDVWDSDDDSQRHSQRQWDLLQEAHGNAGYLEGLTEGKDSTLQTGFNRGYADGVQCGWVLGELRGKLSTIIALNAATMKANETKKQLPPLPTSLVLQLEALEVELCQVKPDTIFTRSHFIKGGKEKEDTCCVGKNKKDATCCGGKMELPLDGEDAKHDNNAIEKLNDNNGEKTCNGPPTAQASVATYLSTLHQRVDSLVEQVDLVWRHQE